MTWCLFLDQNEFVFKANNVEVVKLNCPEILTTYYNILYNTIQSYTILYCNLYCTVTCAVLYWRVGSTAAPKRSPQGPLKIRTEETCTMAVCCFYLAMYSARPWSQKPVSPHGLAVMLLIGLLSTLLQSSDLVDQRRQ